MTSDAQAALTVWWDEQARKGDPSRNPRLVEQAFKAGFAAARGSDARPAFILGLTAALDIARHCVESWRPHDVRAGTYLQGKHDAAVEIAGMIRQRIEAEQ